MAKKEYSLAHTKWMCKYHIVFTHKYRRKVIYNQLRGSKGEILRDLCKYKGVEIIEGHLMPNHVHMLVAIPPKTSVSTFMGYLKGKSALMIFDKHANLKYKFGNRHFWAEGYYVSTVGLNEETVQKYIRDQEKADIAADKLSVKEYEDPFDRDPQKSPLRGDKYERHSSLSTRKLASLGASRQQGLIARPKPPVLRVVMTFHSPFYLISGSPRLTFV